MAQNGCLTQDLRLCSPVLLDFTMDLYSLLTDILTQDEDPADSVPTNDNVDSKMGCMIQ